jgi:hypothetical protein
MALGGIMASGSRGPAAIFGAQLLGIAALGFGGRAIPIRRLLPIIVLTLSAAAASAMMLDRQATAFFSRTEGNDDVGWRLYDVFFQWLDVILQYPLGMGLGAGHQSFAAEIPANVYEVELSRLALKLGLGVLVYVAFKVTLIGQFLAEMKARRTLAGRVTLATCTVILIPPIFIFSVYQPLMNAAFWAFVGIGFWVVKLEAATLPALRAAAPQRARTGPPSRGIGILGEGAR